MKLKKQNKQIALGGMLAMKKEHLIKLISQPVSPDYRKETLIDILNFELLMDQPQIWEGLQ